jgi:hypothetical protein
MLNWEKIDNEKTFQRLVNHLFALECNSPGFIPSSPYMGADGGWDGYYKGYYSNEGIDSLWSIQAKWTKKSFKDAVSSLRPQIKDELKKAKDKKVDHLRIATNAELKVEQVIELEEVNQSDVNTLKIWHREELTRRVELQPYLTYMFFRLPQYPKFVPRNSYFNEVEKSLLSEREQIPIFNDYLDEVRRFIRSQTQNILLIHSPGGYGKSHLLREISKIVHTTDSE